METQFSPLGGEDKLAVAIACFGKLPTAKAKFARGDLPYDLDFQGVNQIESYEAAHNLCSGIGASYSRDLALQKTRIPPSKALKNLETAKHAANALAVALTNLGPQERLMLNVFDDFKAGPELDALAAQYNKVDPEDLPDALNPTGGAVPPGHLAVQVQELAWYLDMLVQARTAQLKRRQKGKTAFKINRTAAGLFAAAPEWALMDKSWRLFTQLGLKRSSTVGSPVHRFAKNIHSWVTRRNDSLDFYFKKYATVRLELDAKIAELSAMARAAGLSRNQLETDCQFGQQRGLDPKVFIKAKSIWTEIQKLENDVLYGT